MTYDLAKRVLKVAAGFHATGYHYLQSQVGVEKFLEDHPEMVFTGWLQAKTDQAREQNEKMDLQTYEHIQVMNSLDIIGDH